MTKKLIALVDGSIYSESLCAHTAWAAGRTGLPVEMLHVLGRREGGAQGDLSGALKLGARSALLEELAELDAQRAKLVAQRGRAILDDARAIVARDAPAEVTTRLRHGDIVDTVAELETDAAMILIGKRGEAADFAKGHLGSNLERILRASHRPVLIAARAFRPIRHVLIAFDGRDAAHKAVAQVARDPLFAGLSVTLAHVGAAGDVMRKALDTAAAQLDTAGRPADTVVLSGQPDAALGAHVAQGGVDMVVMGAFGHSRLRSLIIGSTTTEMIRSCKVPILLVR